MLGALLLALFTCVLFSGCGSDEKAAKPLLVKTETVGMEAGSAYGTFAGTVRGRYETNLAFQVGGQILSRNVDVGSRVEPGQTLMIINAKDVVQQANASNAQVESARANLSLAEVNLSRYRELYAADAVSAATLDQYQTNYDAALASYREALAGAAQSSNALGYTNLESGASGVISSISAEEGQVVSAGQTVMTLVQTGELEVEISVPEKSRAALREGETVTVSFWALGTSTTGSIREISPMADSVTRTYRVRVSLPEPPEGIALGMTADVSIAEAAGEGYILPLSAIYQTGDTPYVWVVTEDDTLELRAVETEGYDENSVRVMGLSAGDVVVTAGVHKLHEGDKVRTEAGA